MIRYSKLGILGSFAYQLEINKNQYFMQKYKSNHIQPSTWHNAFILSQWAVTFSLFSRIKSLVYMSSYFISYYKNYIYIYITNANFTKLNSILEGANLISATLLGSCKFDFVYFITRILSYCLNFLSFSFFNFLLPSSTVLYCFWSFLTQVFSFLFSIFPCITYVFSCSWHWIFWNATLVFWLLERMSSLVFVGEWCSYDRCTGFWLAT